MVFFCLARPLPLVLDLPCAFAAAIHTAGAAFSDLTTVLMPAGVAVSSAIGFGTVGATIFRAATFIESY